MAHKLPDVHARQRGLRLSNNASLFAEKGNPWAQAKDFEEHSLVRRPLTEAEIARVRICNRMETRLRKLGLAKGTQRPLSGFDAVCLDPGNPEFDQYFAPRAVKKTDMKSETRRDEGASIQRRIVNRAVVMKARLKGIK